MNQVLQRKTYHISMENKPVSQDPHLEGVLCFRKIRSQLRRQQNGLQLCDNPAVFFSCDTDDKFAFKEETGYKNAGDLKAARVAGRERK